MPSEDSRPATQKDVARVAGVSIATVSHVLTGRTDRMAGETRRRVLEAIRQLGYKAPPLDPRYHGPHTQTVGVLAPDLATSPIFSNIYFGRILDSVLSACLLRGWGVTVMAERMWDDDGHSIRRTFDGRCDGVLAIAPENDAAVVSFVERGVPVVQIGTTSWHPLISSVDVDNRSIGRRAAERFVGLGHRDLAFIGPQMSVSAKERLEAFWGTATNLGAEVTVREYDTTTTAEEYTSLIGRQGPTAVFCWNEQVALRVYEAASRAGLSIPGDLSVVGVDDHLAGGYDPPLDTFRQPLFEIGQRAVELLIDGIEAGPARGEVVMLEAEFVERGSVGMV